MQCLLKNQISLKVRQCNNSIMIEQKGLMSILLNLKRKPFTRAFRNDMYGLFPAHEFSNIVNLDLSRENLDNF